MSAFFSFGSDSSGVNGSDPISLKNRQPWAAGRFYPDDSLELINDLQELFKKATTQKNNNVFAVISPHAGYYFSGSVAASAFSQIDPFRNYENIFIIASSHRAHFEGASVYSCGDYVTPLGKIPTNIQLAEKLVRENKILSFSPSYHDGEHSLEVQLPFLQAYMKSKIRIVPIIIGTDKSSVCKEIANALKPYLIAENNLFIISSDFSHYPSSSDAINTDYSTTQAICTNRPASLLKTLSENENNNIKNLATSLCGYTSVLTLLYMTEDLPKVEVTPVLYRNSGDTPDGDKTRVVGYQSISFSRITTENEPQQSLLSSKDKVDLLEIARNTLEHFVRTGETLTIDTTLYSKDLSVKLGAFVSLHKNGNLRGCIGRFTAEEPLYKLIKEMAIAAAFSDNRFLPVEKKELAEIEIEISVLTPLKKIKNIHEIVLGKHGIYIRKGWKSGTFLPQVATETKWTLEEFLTHCAHDKAGLDNDGWKDAEIYTYEAIVFNEQ